MHPLVSLVKTFGFLIRTPAEGAYTTIYCIITPEDQMHNGGYYRWGSAAAWVVLMKQNINGITFLCPPYSNCAAAESSIAGQDDGTALKLWAISCHMLGIRWR